MELRRCLDPQVRSYSLSRCSFPEMLRSNSVVEINTSIKVACMPACASCLRYLLSKVRSFIACRYSDTKTSKNVSSSRAKNSTFESKRPQGSRYWRLREWRGKGDGPPQITVATQKSGQELSLPNLTMIERNDFHVAEKTSLQESVNCSGDESPLRRDDLV